MGPSPSSFANNISERCERGPYVQVKTIRKNSQPKKSTFTTLKGCLKDFGVRGKIRKRSKNRFFGLRVFFLIILTTYRFNRNLFPVDRTKPEVAHFIGAKKKVPFKMVRFQ